MYKVVQKFSNMKYPKSDVFQTFEEAHQFCKTCLKSFREYNSNVDSLYLETYVDDKPPIREAIILNNEIQFLWMNWIELYEYVLTHQFLNLTTQEFFYFISNVQDDRYYLQLNLDTYLEYYTGVYRTDYIKIDEHGCSVYDLNKFRIVAIEELCKISIK